MRRLHSELELAMARRRELKREKQWKKNEASRKEKVTSEALGSRLLAMPTLPRFPLPLPFARFRATLLELQSFLGLTAPSLTPQG
jgi:hypothetical protein